jgi:hypothetical protein
MPGKIFINYRRDDDPSYTQALYQRLEDEFASAELFMDVEGRSNPGDDFVEVLSTQVGACDVMLAIIGPRWTALLADRLNDPADFVALELRTAFAMDKRVIRHFDHLREFLRDSPCERSATSPASSSEPGSSTSTSVCSGGEFLSGQQRPQSAETQT